MSGIEMEVEPGTHIEVKAVSGPAEIYEPVQTLHFWEDSNLWLIETEDETIYDVKEIYCNVPSATCSDSGNLCPNGTCMVATGRLTISSGVAYVDVG